MSELKWTKSEPTDGDPVWYAQLGGLRLSVEVPTGCPWHWEWEIDTSQEGDIARGSVYVEHKDDEEDDWDYQGVEQVQARCEAVARVLLDGEQSRVRLDHRAMDALRDGRILKFHRTTFDDGRAEFYAESVKWGTYNRDPADAILWVVDKED
jgi:hypothetical protein